MMRFTRPVIILSMICGYQGPLRCDHRDIRFFEWYRREDFGVHSCVANGYHKLRHYRKLDLQYVHEISE